ncbi:MAG: Ig-like domain-containing protein [Saprospiraceae bacterium]
MKAFKLFALLMIVGVFVTSCGDDDSTAPVVTISSPANGANFLTGDVVTFESTITEDTKLSLIKLTSDLGLDESITQFNSDTNHNGNYNITIDSNTVAGSYSIVLTATDDAGNVGSDQVEVNVQ